MLCRRFPIVNLSYIWPYMLYYYYRYIVRLIFELATLCNGKVFYGQEPPSEESTTTECGVNYQLLVVMY